MKKGDIWFPAKTYGWGWGLPVTWQGWFVYGGALAMLAGAFFVFPPTEDLALFMVSTWGIIVLLVAVCWLKGERPSWRWGR